MERIVQTRKKRRQLYLFIFWMLLSAVTAAATRYVDPVNGNDEWNGLWMESFPEADLGPVATIQAAAALAEWRDTIVLMDGIYSGEQNTGQGVFDGIVYNGVHLWSLHGPENCILEFSIPLNLISNRSNGYEIIGCTFDGITFVSDQYIDGQLLTLTNINLLFQNCIFRNFDISGLFYCSYRVHLELKDCTFRNNALNYFMQFNAYVPVLQSAVNSSTLFLSNCLFHDNEIYNCGISINQDIQADIENCSFDQNILNGTSSRDYPGSIIQIKPDAETRIAGCSFTNNTCFKYCSFIDVERYAAADIDSCVIENNSASDTEYPLCGITCFPYSKVNISNTQIRDLQHSNQIKKATYGIWAQQPTSLAVKNCKINNNSTGLYCSGYFSQSESNVTISDSEFTGNTFPYSQEPKDGCGICIMETNHSNTLVERCTISHNQNGIFTTEQDPTSSLITNCLIVGNEGYALYCLGSYPESLLPLKNCTFVDNPAGIHAEFTHFKNCIVRNTFFDESSYEVTVDYSFVQGGWNGPGTGNITEFPQFGSYIDGDYHLKSLFGRYDPALNAWVQDDIHSPCIDTGDPADLIGEEPYGSGGRINMGCYGGTWQASKSAICTGGIDGTGKMLSDFNHDCVVNLADFAWFASEWLHTTSITD